MYLYSLLVFNNITLCTLFMQVLTNLIILELYGNPLLDKLENYRIYLVFQLPALKALDGVRVVGAFSKALLPSVLTPSWSVFTET